jgi:putative transcriptional regulator
MESELAIQVHIHNRVKELRDDRGWTQQDLADAVGVSRQSINSIERHRYVPSLALALAFSRVFQCPTDRIFSLEEMG